MYWFHILSTPLTRRAIGLARPLEEHDEISYGGAVAARSPRRDARQSRVARDAAERAAARGQASIYLLTAKAAVAAFTIADAVRPESRVHIASPLPRDVRFPAFRWHPADHPLTPALRRIVIIGHHWVNAD